MPVPQVSEKFFEEQTLSKDEQDAESMISLMSEMRNLQMRNKANPGISDEQRHKDAEAMMHKLAAMMGMDGDEYDSEGDNQW